MRWWNLLLSMVVAATPWGALAATSVSPNLKMVESVVGGGGLVNEKSTNLQAGESIGDVGVGHSTSANLGIDSGYTTTADPTLSLTVIDSNLNFGVFSAGAATTLTSRFSVSNYTSYGYAIQIVGNTPTNGSHSITALSASTPSQVGVEQYGLNLVANTSPFAFGANPNNGVNGQGAAVGSYATPNNYKYVPGETVAAATKSSGLTTYTVSQIINVTNLTPGGQYSSVQTIICTGMY